ncbi:MAG: beta-ketoacyl-[acyl-carrier-protein] synthase family protein [Pirellulales bacterium]|nr:beta-ketoacyl-[acyl-carrier-protein] synthase family protein [Pirellulales bacterium]
MSAGRRVVITGLGVVSPLGNSAEALATALAAGTSGVAPLTTIPPLEGLVTYGGEAREFTGDIDNFGELDKDMKKSIRKALKMMCRESMMAVAAAQQALARSALVERVPERVGVVFGSDYMLSPPDDLLAGMIKCGVAAGGLVYEQWGTEGLREMNPLWMLNYLPNMPASHIAIFNDLRGPNNSLTMREASGVLAIREAAQTIERGHADAMLAGATGTRIHSFKTIHATQTEELADPALDAATACRPFDRRRTGMVCGEGAGAVMLEEREAALARGATIYGEILGTGSAAVADANLVARKADAFAAAGRQALADAGIDGAALGHVNAHALGDRAGDEAEATAIGRLLGTAAATAPVAAAKSYFGNLGAGSGVVELIASLLSWPAGSLFGTLNFTEADPACPVRASRHGDPCGETFLKLSATPQGQAAALVVGRG